jgi:FtsZ-binding cell division protein ZapB
MQSVQDYLSKINSFVGQGYWSGTFAQIATEQLWNENKARLPSWYNAHLNAKTLWMGKRVMDCCGLDKGGRWIQPDGSVKYDPATDLNESMLFDKAKALGKKWGAINTIPDIAGLIVCKTGHMGIYRGNGEVVESRGGDYGVVVTKVFERGWEYWYEEPFLDYSGGSKMLYKGCPQGEAVAEWQKSILQIYPSALPKYGADSDFGGETETWTNTFKRAEGLAENGIVDEITYGRMLKKLRSMYSVENANLVSANNEIAVLSESVKAKTATISSLSLENTNLKSANATLVQEKLALANEVASKTSTITALQNENGMLERDNAELDKKIESDKFKIDTIDQRERDHKEVVDNLNEQIAILKISK